LPPSNPTVNRRTFSKLLAGAAGLRAQAQNTIEAGGAKIDVSFHGEFDLSHAELMNWVERCAAAVTRYFGRFPVARASIAVAEGRRAGVSSGRSFGENGAHSRLMVGRHATAKNLEDDWMLTHEMVHFGFPSVEERHHWMEEGSATYIEPIARVETGWLTAEKIWNDMIRDMPQGLPQPGDQGLDNTHTWGRTYWGGAIFCLLADLEIRKRTKNKKGLQDALRAVNAAGGSIETEWPLERAFEIGDRTTGSNCLMELYREMGSKPVPVDLPALWKQLGVVRQDDRVTFDDHAPLAKIRAAITTSSTLP
jgi:hypothetical protein